MNLTIADTAIRTDATGRYCLNDLHRASGGAPHHQPGKFFANKGTAALVEEVRGASPNSETPVVTVNDGRNNGTFVAKELVYAYAMWISPAFHLKVIRAYDALVSAAAPAIPADYPAALRLAAEECEGRLKAEAALRAAAPKVELADNFLRADNGVDGDVAAKELAKEFKIGRNRLYALLRGWGIFNAENLPYQPHVDHGRFYLQPGTYKGKDGEDRQKATVRFTAKGIAYCRALLQRRCPELARPSTSRELAAA